MQRRTIRVPRAPDNQPLLVADDDERRRATTARRLRAALALAVCCACATIVVLVALVGALAVRGHARRSCEPACTCASLDASLVASPLRVPSAPVAACAATDVSVAFEWPGAACGARSSVVYTVAIGELLANGSDALVTDGAFVASAAATPGVGVIGVVAPFLLIAVVDFGDDDAPRALTATFEFASAASSIDVREPRVLFAFAALNSAPATAVDASAAVAAISVADVARAAASARERARRSEPRHALVRASSVSACTQRDVPTSFARIDTTTLDACATPTCACTAAFAIINITTTPRAEGQCPRVLVTATITDGRPASLCTNGVTIDFAVRATARIGVDTRALVPRAVSESVVQPACDFTNSSALCSVFVVGGSCGVVTFEFDAPSVSSDAQRVALQASLEALTVSAPCDVSSAFRQTLVDARLLECDVERRTCFVEVSVSADVTAACECFVRTTEAECDALGALYAATTRRWTTLDECRARQATCTGLETPVSNVCVQLTGRASGFGQVGASPLATVDRSLSCANASTQFAVQRALADDVYFFATDVFARPPVVCDHTTGACVTKGVESPA